MKKESTAPFQTLLPIYLVIFFGYIGYSLIITIFTPIFLYHQQGILPAETSEHVRVLCLGLVIFLYPFGQFLSSPILGAISDRLGRRGVLLFSLVIATLVYACVGIGVLKNNFWVIAVSLLVAGLCEGNITLAQSTIADVTAPSERSRYFGYIYFSASLSYIAGPLLGGWLADPPTYSPIAFATPFFVVSILLFALLCWLYVGFKESLPARKRKKIPYRDAFTNLKNLFYMRHVRSLFLINFLLYLAIFGFFQSFPVYLVTKFKIDVWTLSLFIAWSSAPFLIVNLWLTGHMAKRFSPVQIALFSAIWIGIFLELLLIPSHQGAFWVSLFLVGLGVAFCLPSIVALLSEAAHASEQGRVMGINQSLQFFAEALSGLLVGFLASLFVHLTFIIFGFISLLGALLLLKKKHFSLR